MAKYDQSLEAKWNKNDIIRHKATGHPYLVVHVYFYVCTILIDLEDKEELPRTFTLLPRDYHKYATDQTMEQIKKNEMMIWEYNPQLMSL